MTTLPMKTVACGVPLSLSRLILRSRRGPLEPSRGGRAGQERCNQASGTHLRSRMHSKEMALSATLGALTTRQGASVSPDTWWRRGNGGRGVGGSSLRPAGPLLSLSLSLSPRTRSRPRRS